MEEKIVIDTNIIVNYERKKSKLLEKYLKLQERKKVKVFISTVTLFEYYSSQLLEDKKYYDETEELFSLFNIQEVNSQIAKLAAYLNRRHRLYRRVDMGDILIAATCFYLDAKLLTENKKHFRLIPKIKFAR